MTDEEWKVKQIVNQLKVTIEIRDLLKTIVDALEDLKFIIGAQKIQ